MILISKIFRAARSSSFLPFNISSSLASIRMEHCNRLANQKSPYLLQHKHNPIDWYSWGEEAFTAARERNVPIFLSVGYSTCHWCHVMERESFENEEIAKILNENFVSIKVDKEERPDVDTLYMTFIQAISGGGGWPMSVFLTPQLEPITGGTYFPPEDQFGRTGFPSILKIITEKWNEDPELLKAQGASLLQAIKSSFNVTTSDLPPAEKVREDTFQHKARLFDPTNGGFGDAPKFPKPVKSINFELFPEVVKTNPEVFRACVHAPTCTSVFAVDLDFLIHYAVISNDTSKGQMATEMVDKTLDAMNRGGIHDHVGKGFHRYSVDTGWHVPHFEKMLYDQTQLLATYSRFHALTGKYATTIRDIAEYMDSCLSHPEGGFYSAEDADSLPQENDSAKKEGAFCVWKKSEIEEVLKNWKAGGNQLSDVVSEYFGIQEEGNVPRGLDPHGELTGQNVLIMRKTHKEVAEEFSLNEGELHTAIDEAKAFLAARRALRPKPHLDSKIVTCWQGMAISGLSKAYSTLKDEAMLARIEKNIDFVKTYLTTPDGDLRRAVYTGEDGAIEQLDPVIEAFSDDYASMIQGLLDFYDVTLDQSYVEWAVDLQKRQDSKFWDSEGKSGYFVGSVGLPGAPDVRVMEDQDGAGPCCNSVSLCNLARLYGITGNTQYKETANHILHAVSQRLTKYPFILCKMIPAYSRLEEGTLKIVVVGSGSDARTRTFIDYIQGVRVWNKVLVHIDNSKAEPSYLETQSDMYKEMRNAKEPSVYICEGFVCGTPITTGEQLKEKLEGLKDMLPQKSEE